MKYIVYLLGFLWIAAGAIAILYTDDYKAYIKGLMARLDRMVLALIPAIFGLLLLFAASSTTHSWFIGLIGILGIAKGVLTIRMPKSGEARPAERRIAARVGQRGKSA